MKKESNQHELERENEAVKQQQFTCRQTRRPHLSVIWHSHTLTYSHREPHWYFKYKDKCKEVNSNKVPAIERSFPVQGHLTSVTSSLRFNKQTTCNLQMHRLMMHLTSSSHHLSLVSFFLSRSFPLHLENSNSSSPLTWLHWAGRVHFRLRPRVNTLLLPLSSDRRVASASALTQVNRMFHTINCRFICKQLSHNARNFIAC